MKEGFYWVKYHGYWTIGKYIPILNFWVLSGGNQVVSPDELDQIGDYIEMPEKYKEVKDGK